jgi:hypothetical protein
MLESCDAVVVSISDSRSDGLRLVSTHLCEHELRINAKTDRMLGRLPSRAMPSIGCSDPIADRIGTAASLRCSIGVLRSQRDVTEGHPKARLQRPRSSVIAYLTVALVGFAQALQGDV